MKLQRKKKQKVGKKKGKPREGHRGRWQKERSY
jgi:hypothetical protein